jgi:hypothetical protein
VRAACAAQRGAPFARISRGARGAQQGSQVGPCGKGGDGVGRASRKWRQGAQGSSARRLAGSTPGEGGRGGFAASLRAVPEGCFWQGALAWQVVRPRGCKGLRLGCAWARVCWLRQGVVGGEEWTTRQYQWLGFMTPLQHTHQLDHLRHFPHQLHHLHHLRHFPQRPVRDMYWHMK